MTTLVLNKVTTLAKEEIEQEVLKDNLQEITEESTPVKVKKTRKKKPTIRPEDKARLEVVKDRRKSYGVTLIQISEQMLMSPTYYSAVENGRRARFVGEALDVFIEDVTDAIDQCVNQRKIDSYILAKNISDGDEDPLVWQILTAELYSQVVARLKKGDSFYRVCVDLEVDELEIASKLKHDGLAELITD